LIVDDGSSPSEYRTVEAPPIFRRADILRLRRNLGHQRAIAIGLAWLHENQSADAIVVMDGDGEDKPDDVPRLLDRFAEMQGTHTIFAERTRRSESVAFTVMYRLYQFSHRILTGIPVKIGNFSVLSPEHLDSIVVSSDMWNHYAAAAVRLRIPIATVPTHRGFRYQGRSRMNFTALIRHGLCALAVHSDIIAVRFLTVAVALCLLCLGLLGACVGIRIFTDLAIPGWATYVTALLVILLLQIASITFSITVHAFSNANSNSFIPIRDFVHFVRTTENLPQAIGQFASTNVS
jgi:polyisoprenyl-phosphate glycosyltransferase